MSGPLKVILVLSLHARLQMGPWPFLIISKKPKTSDARMLWKAPPDIEHKQRNIVIQAKAAYDKSSGTFSIVLCNNLVT